MSYSTLELAVEANVAVVSFNNPPVNSITAQMVDDIAAVFDDLAGMGDVRAVVLASKLEKAFIAGADINQFLSWDKAVGMAEAGKGSRIYAKIAKFRCPVICAINGFAFGGGLELALACDIRVIDKKAKVGLPETGLGIYPGYGGTQRCPRLVGGGMAKKLIFTGAPIDGEEAWRIGLAEVLAEPGESLAQAMKLAKQIAGQAPMAVAYAKDSIDYALNNPIDAGLEYENQRIGDLFGSEDKMEGAKAFLEKRKANFVGK